MNGTLTSFTNAKNKKIGWPLGVFLLLVVVSLSCLASGGPAEPSAVADLPTVETPTARRVVPSTTPRPSATLIPSSTLTNSPTVTPSSTQTITRTPTLSPSPTISQTPTISPLPTFAFPTLVALMQANCRYGPSTAYLFAHGMYPGDTATVWGRNASGTWLYIQPDNIQHQCWIAASVVEVTGDIFTLVVQPVRLPHSKLYNSVQTVWATREGEQVMVAWEGIWMTEDDFRGYMIEAVVCQNGNLVWMAVQTNSTSYEFLDEPGCDGASWGLLYAVEKHGYTDPITIPWP